MSDSDLGRKLLVLLVTALLMPSAAWSQGRQWGQDRTITQISEHVYRWGSDGQFGAYVLTDDGIVVIDGHYCQSGTTAWLKEELAARHSVPVRFVVLSHDHQDHICHTDIFADTAVTISHRKLRPHVVRENRIAAVPEITFEQELDLHVGGVAMTLYYFGPSHSDNLIHMHIPDEEVLISIDVARNSLFPDLRDMDVHGMLEVYDELARLDDVEIVVPGHGPLLERGVFRQMQSFLQTLHDDVLDRMIAGQSLPQIRRAIQTETYAGFGLAGVARSLDTNIVTMYDYLYRYREPNRRIEPVEAVACIEDSSDCRTAD